MPQHCHDNNDDEGGHSEEKSDPSCCPSGKRIDYLLWSGLGITIITYLQAKILPELFEKDSRFTHFGHSIEDFVDTMWWGIALGILMICLLSKVPREFVLAVLGKGGTFTGLIRATLAGVLLDMCSHGILMVGAKLYERGASTGQVMAFLIASPWNSLSLTFILIALVGLKWTLLFILFSVVIALISGVIFEFLTRRHVLPENPNTVELSEDFNLFREAKEGIKSAPYSVSFFKDMLCSGIKESRMVLRWIFFGLILAALIRTFVSPEAFATYFGPTLAGLGLTLVVATILEVCSEGTVPIAADILNRARAPGNGFTFLMAGVATDYTEFMILRETTGRWIIPLFLPLVTLPQILLIGWLMNIVATG